jgi:FkbM family methyltransferase
MKDLFVEFILGIAKIFYWSWILKTPFFKWVATKILNFYLKIQNDYILVNTKLGFDIYVSKTDLVIWWLLMRDRIFEPEITNVISNKIKEGDVFVDIGANIGYYSLLAQSRACKVYAFEPSPSNYSLLQKNISLNKEKHKGAILAYNYWLGEIKEERTLFYNSQNPWASTILSEIARNSMDDFQEKVTIVVLDEFLRDVKADFIKIDVEWYETFVLRGMKNFLLQEHLKIMMEYVPSAIEKADELNASRDMFNTFIENGFHIFVVNVKNGSFTEVYSYDDYMEKFWTVALTELYIEK